MKSHDIIPRVLADDLLTLAVGQNATYRFIRASLDTYEYLVHIGAVVRATETFVFSHSRAARHIHSLVRFGKDNTKVTLILEVSTEEP